MPMESLSSRKDRHLDFFRQTRSGLGTTRLDEVPLHARAFSSVFPDDTDLGSVFLGTPVGAPLFLASVTGGTPEGKSFNESCALAARQFGLPMATGSLRILLEHPETFHTFDVNRDGQIPLFYGNLGLGAALHHGARAVKEVCSRLNMTGLYLHVNHAQEVVQPKSERMPADPLAVREFILEFGAPVCIKETGMGFSESDISLMSDWSVSALDTGGAGGSNFFQVETTARDTDGTDAKTGASDLTGVITRLGHPTACVIRHALALGIPVIAGGGIRTATDVAAAIALGAFGASMAAPLVHAWHMDPHQGICRLVDQTLDSLRLILALCGCRNPAELRELLDNPCPPDR